MKLKINRKNKNVKKIHFFLQYKFFLLLLQLEKTLQHGKNKI